MSTPKKNELTWKLEDLRVKKNVAIPKRSDCTVALGVVRPCLVTETVVHCSKTSNFWVAFGIFLQHISIEKVCV